MWRLPKFRTYIAVIVGLIALKIVVDLWSSHVRGEQTAVWRRDHGRSAPFAELVAWFRSSKKEPDSEPSSQEPATPSSKDQAIPDQGSSSSPAPTSTYRPVAPKLPTAVASGPTPESQFPLHRPTSIAQADRARAAGCVPGAPVAAKQMTHFFQLGVDPPKWADVGDTMTVASKIPVSGDLCNVIFDNPKQGGAIAVSDIGPRSEVEDAVAKRDYNRIEALNLAEFPEKFRVAVAQRATAHSIDMARYETTLEGVEQLVSLCSEITNDRYWSAVYDRGKNSDSMETYNRYKDCQSSYWGALVKGDPHGIFVRIDLRDEKSGQKYRVRLQFESPVPGSGALPPKERSLTEFAMDYFDAYGIGYYAFEDTPNN